MEEANLEENNGDIRPVLSEFNKGNGTPKKASPEEIIIMHRGPRRIPETWSPLNFNRCDLLCPPKDKTPEKYVKQRPEISSKLRRRLNLSPTKNEGSFGSSEMIKKLKCLPKFNNNNDTHKTDDKS